MTPQELADFARQQYNATGDEFFADAELLKHVYDAENQLALRARCIRTTYTTTSVASQQEYTLPTTFLGLFRATYNSRKMSVVTLDELLSMTESSTASTSGIASTCAVWDDTLYLGPIPSASSVTIKIWGYTAPTAPTATSELSVPIRHQFKIVNYLLSRFAAKDNNTQMLTFYQRMWEDDLQKAVDEEKQLQRTGGFAVVRNEDYEFGVE